jgi:hypothetical protein
MLIESMSVIESRPTDASVSAVTIIYSGGARPGPAKVLATDASQTFKYLSLFVIVELLKELGIPRKLI